MLLRGERVVLRFLRAADLPWLQRWDRDADVVRYVGTKFGRSMGPAAWFTALIEDPSRLGFAIVSQGRLIGDLELEDIDPATGSAELRVCIGNKSLWGRGLGTDAVSTAVGYAFCTLGLGEIRLRVQSDNRRAIRCYKKCGFRMEGVLRAGRRRSEGWTDIVLMVRRLLDTVSGTG